MTTDLITSMSQLTLDPHRTRSNTDGIPPRTTRSIRERAHTSSCTCHACSIASPSQSRLLSWAMTDTTITTTTTTTTTITEDTSMIQSYDISQDKPWLLTPTYHSPPPIYRRVARPINLPARPTFEDDEDVIKDKMEWDIPVPMTPISIHPSSISISQLQSITITPTSTSTATSTSTSQLEIKIDSAPRSSLIIHPSSPFTTECKTDCESPAHNYMDTPQHTYTDTSSTHTTSTHTYDHTSPTHTTSNYCWRPSSTVRTQASIAV